MRWKIRPKPSIHSKRSRTKYLWWPRQTWLHWVWLEFICVTEEYRFLDHRQRKAGWVEVDWNIID